MVARRVFGILQKQVVLQEKGLGSRIDNYWIRNLISNKFRKLFFLRELLNVLRKAACQSCLLFIGKARLSTSLH